MTELDNYVTDVLMRDLIGHDKRPVSFLIYLWLAAEEQRRAAPVQISYQELAESIGVSRSSAQTSVGWLIRRKLLEATRVSVTATPAYRVCTHGEKSIRHRKQGTHLISCGFLQSLIYW
jgi:hypothetical protein